MNQIAKRQSAQLAVHGKLAELFGDQLGGDDLTGGVSVGFPVLSIKGKVFHIKQGGEATLVTQPNSEDPATSLEVVLVKANKHISKVFYATGYTEGSDAKPTCYSNNGEQPEADSEEIQSDKCATCPQNQWGARITDDGRKAKACSDSRRVAVAPAGDLSNVMLLRVPAASLRPLSDYGKALNKRGVPYQAVVTKLSFDHTVAHPLLKFAPVAALPEDKAVEVYEAMTGDIVESILQGGGAEQIAAEAAGEVEDDEEQFDTVAAAAKTVAATKPATTKPATAAKTTTRPAARAAAATVSAAEVAEAVGEVAQNLAAPSAGKPTPSAAAAANAATTDGSDLDAALGDLLKDFSDSN